MKNAGCKILNTVVKFFTFHFSLYTFIISGCVKNIGVTESLLTETGTPHLSSVLGYRVLASGTIEGLVYESDGKTPIPGVMVWAYDKYGDMVSCARTDMHGKYTIYNLPAQGGSTSGTRPIGRHICPLYQGEYILQIRSDEFYGTRGKYAGEYYKNAYTPQDANIVSVHPGKTTKDIHFLLSKGGAMSGKIVAQNTNAPVALTPIFLKAYKSKNLGIIYFSSTDSAGNYIITGLEPGVYNKFTIEPEGWLSKSYEKNILILENTISGIDFEVTKGGAISGNVTPPEPAQIQVIGKDRALEKQADSTGFYLISGLPEGNYTVKAVPSYESQYAWQYWKKAFASSSATPVSVTGTDTTRGIDFQFTDEGIISGSVKDKRGKPVEDFEIKLYTLDGEKLPQDFGFHIADGIYKIDGVPEGKYILKINSFSPRTLNTYQSSYYKSTIRRACARGVTSDFKNAIPVEVKSGYNTAGVNFKLKEGCIIQGFLLLNGYLVSADSIRFTVLAFNTKTGAVFTGKHTFMGGYRITGLPAGEYKLCVLAQEEDFSAIWLGGGRSFNDPKTEVIRVGRGNCPYPTEVNFSLAPGNLEISGKVYDNNEPVSYNSEAQIIAYDSMGYIVQIGKYTAESYIIKGLPSGKYFLRTYKFKGYKDRWYKAGWVGGTPHLSLASGMMSSHPTQFVAGIDIDKAPYIAKIPAKIESIELINKSVSNIDFNLSQK